MAFNAGTIIAQLRLNAAQFTQQMQASINQARLIGQQMRNAFNPAPINGANGAAKNLSSTFKDLERIVSGILISQAFYRTLNAIKQGTAAVYQFSNNMQQAAISMEYFLGTKDRAERFLNVMKDFAAITPFTTEQTVNLSRRLMAMGFAADSVKSVMGIMTDAASATGGTAEQMDRVVLALGQMKTNGYIAGQELRQLAEAGIPVYRILKEELKLTTDQLRKIGKLKISGDLGVAAVLRGLEKRYKDAAAKIAETIPGLTSTIKDDFLMLSEAIVKGPYKSLQVFLKGIRDAMEKARAIVRSNGIGSLFQTVVPLELLRPIRLIIASITSLKASFGNLLKALKPAAAVIGGGIVKSLAILLPIVASVVHWISILAAAALNACAPLRTLTLAITGIIVAYVVGKALLFFWRVVRLGTICSLVASAVDVLTIAIKALFVATYRHPIVALITVLVGALLYLALTSKMVSGWLNNLFDSFTKLGGISTDGILAPTKTAAAGTDEFNKRLEEMDDNLEDVGKSAEKAGKKTKNAFSSSFDELYQIPDLLGSLTDAEDDLADVNPMAAFDGLGGLSDIKAPSLPELGLPDVGFLTNKLTDIFKGIGDTVIEFFTKTVPSSVGTFFSSTLPSFVDKAKLAFATLSTIIKDGSWTTPLKDGLDNVSKWVDTWAPEPVAKFVSFMTELGKGALDGFATILSTVWKFGEDFITWSSTLGPATAPYFSTIWEGTKTIFSVACDELSSIVTIVFDGLKAFWATWGNDITGLFTNTWELIKYIVGEAIGLLGEVITLAFENIRLFWELWGDDITAFFTDLFELVVAIIGPIIDGLMLTIKEAFEALKTFWDDWGGTILTILGNVWDNMKEVFSIALDIILNTVGSVFKILNNIVQLALNLLKGNWSGAWNNIKTILQTVLDWIVMIIGNVLQLVVTTVSTFGKNVYAVWLGIWNNLKKSLSSTWDDITSKVSSVTDSMIAIFRTMKTTIVGVFSTMWIDIKSFINLIIGGLNKVIDALNGLNVDIPSIDIPGIGKIGGGSIGIPVKIPNIPKLERGGIIDKHQLIEAGEHNRREVMIPLDNDNYMRPFSSAVANDLVSMLGGNQGGNRNENTEVPIVLYIGTLIGDDRSYTELERRLGTIRRKDAARIGGM